jgi:hypothetical protein
MPLYIRILLIATAPLCFLRELVRGFFVSKDTYDYTFSIFTVFMILVLFTSNLFMYRVVQKQTREIAETQVRNIEMRSDLQQGNPLPEPSTSHNRSREITRFYAYCGCVIMTALLFSPFCFYHLLVALKLVVKSKTLILVLSSFCVANPIFDAVISIRFNKVLREKFRLILRKTSTRQNVEKNLDFVV